MTPFFLLLQLSGLSQREAASFLHAPASAVDKWARGVRTAPDRVLAELKSLIARQDDAAEQALIFIDKQYVTSIEIGFPVDDHEAQSLGWPCVGAWRGMAARVIANCQLPIDLVPRGSTPATAMAADRYEKRNR